MGVKVAEFVLWPNGLLGHAFHRRVGDTMAKKVRKKIRKRVRKRDWESLGDVSFSVDRARHLRTGAIPDGEERVPSLPEGRAPNGLVVSLSGSWAFVTWAGDEVACRIDDRLMVGRSSVLVPGDEVWVDREQDTLFVRFRGERRTKLSRVSTRAGRVQEQVIAANVDLLVIVASVLEPRFKAGLVDRYLVAAGVGGVTPLLCLNKMDLTDLEPPEVAVYEQLGLKVIRASCKTGQGIADLGGVLQGKLSVLAGHSGVGKSSIINALAPCLGLGTQSVSRLTEKGRHTTAASRLYEIAGDIRIIDTPGIRQLGVWGVSHDALAFYFPEMERLALKCRFRDCTHVHEPDCAVRDAVEQGSVSQLRYQSYLHIRDSL